MYKDIISYQLADGVSEQHLLTVSKNILTNWMSKQQGFVKWEIHKNNDKGYTDIVYWNTKKDAKNAEKEMVTIPNSPEWFACYKEGSISSKNLDKIKTLN